MKTAATTALACLLAGFGSSLAMLHDRDHYEGRFSTWMEEHGIHIPSGPEFAMRLENFIENSDFIEKHNGGNHTYSLGHNRFSHLTYDEFKKMYLGWSRPLLNEEEGEVAMARRQLQDEEAMNLPKSIDWVEKGAVTPVKDQGQCGSCYTFSATGAIEGAYAIKTGQLVELSMQQVVDCDGLDYGCNGGEMNNVFQWVEQNGGLCALEDYPYTSGTTQNSGTCQTNCQVVPGTAPTSWKNVRPHFPYMLMSAVAKQPVAVAVAVSRDWMFYEKGVFSGECGKQLDHGILAVGYGTDPQGEDYWKVKNSWGTGWGEQGYIYLSRDKASSCGILKDSSYPILSGQATTESKEEEEETPLGVSTTGSASAKDCGGATAVFKSIVITPSDVHKNDLITMRASGVLNKPTKSGSYTIHVKYAGAELYSHTGNVCGNEKVELPLGAGTIQLYGLKCPQNPGPVYYGLDVILPSIAPNGDYIIKINGKDQDGTPLLCIQANLSI